MSEVRQGRWTARIEGDFVVFLIGARLDKRHLLRSLVDLGGRRGMPAMLRELSADPDRGLLGYELAGPFSTLVIQYWRSFEALESWANSKDDPHAAVWREYWRRVGKQTRTGIWHETYLVRAGEYEAVYGNMPPYGLAKASALVPLQGSTARNRLGAAARRQVVPLALEPMRR
jgi:hypothetical protein